jgi:outer membrane receptor for ferrienterochelin and colicin
VIRKTPVLLAAFLWFSAATAWGQGVQTGTLTGTVKLSDGSSAPGALVTIESPALQGKRTQTTGATGGYVFKFLPPGEYTVRFELPGMRPIAQNATISLGTTTQSDAVLQLSASETVSVSAKTVVVETSAVHGSTYDDKVIAQLPLSNRNLDQIAALTPGLTQNINTPNPGQVRISGSFAYDNVFLVDGVDVSESIYGRATDQLYVEDAVEETQVLTSGISAEYGRFSGGVINAVTRNGGNDYHGSVRADFSNDKWQSNTPYENAQGVKRANKTNEVYSATLGGKIVTDRLWFFLAGRYFDTAAQRTLPLTGTTYADTDKQDRYEIKLTGNISDGHSLQAAYTRSDDTHHQPWLTFTVEDLGVVTPKRPTSLFVARYQGVLTPNLSASLQYSEKKFGIRDNGGTGNDIVHDSPFLSGVVTTPYYHYGAPYFDATERRDRNNRQWAGSLSYFLSTLSLGSHDLKLGGELYSSIDSEVNQQSPTGYVFQTDYETDANGNPVYDSSHHLIPTFTPDLSFLYNFIVFRGAETMLHTDSLYLNDNWRLNDHLSATLGVRYERATGTGPGGAKLSDTHAVMPRLGVTYDVKGDGKYRLSGTYAQYSGKYNETFFALTTHVGNPNAIYYYYTGPAGAGYDFAPGFDLNNYQVFGGYFPTANVSLAPGLSAPITTEWTFSAGGQVTPDISAAITYVNRRVRNVIEDFINTSTGQTDVVVNGTEIGRFDNILYKNTNGLHRNYESIEFLSRGRITPRWMAEVNYTYMLKLDGNYEGEAPYNPGIPSVFGNYPETLAPDRQFPSGHLSGYQKHKLRILTNYALPTRAGTFNFGMLCRFDSGSPYSLTTTIPYTDVQLARAAGLGYANLPQNETIYFGGRGAYTFPSQSRFDLALNYEIPVWKTVSTYLKLQVINVFNTHYEQGFDTTVIANSSGPVDANGIPTTFTKSGTFGKAIAASQYQDARRFDVTMAFRF